MATEHARKKEGYNSVSRIVTGIGRKHFPGSYGTGTGGNRQCIAPLIFWMAGMAPYPVECDAMSPEKGDKPHPKVRILHLGKAFGLPSLPLSFVDGIDDIGRVAPYMHLGILPLYGFKPTDYCKEFHPVICCK